ncbi:MAG: hypothetical protein AAB877_01350 [Patescibacteria group bacterium]
MNARIHQGGFTKETPPPLAAKLQTIGNGNGKNVALQPMPMADPIPALPKNQKVGAILQDYPLTLVTRLKTIAWVQLGFIFLLSGLCCLIANIKIKSSGSAGPDALAALFEKSPPAVPSAKFSFEVEKGTYDYSVRIKGKVENESERFAILYEPDNTEDNKRNYGKTPVMKLAELNFDNTYTGEFRENLRVRTGKIKIVVYENWKKVVAEKIIKG